jgi:hypothetical protein
MPLKGTAKSSVYDLRKGSSVKWLGFKISKGDNTLNVRIATKAWERLEEYLLLAHQKPDASIRAKSTIDGWIDQMGPCFPFVPRPRVYERLAKLAAKQAFDEIPSRDAMTSRWRRAYKRWCGIRDDVKEHPNVLDSIWNRQADNGSPAGSLQAGAEDQSPPTAVGNSAPSTVRDPSVAPWE